MAKITIVSNRIINRASLTGRRGVRKGVKYVEFCKDGQLFGADQTCMLADREVGGISGVRERIKLAGYAGVWYSLPEGGVLGYYEGGANSTSRLPRGTAFNVVQAGSAAASSTYWVQRPDVDYSLGL